MWSPVRSVVDPMTNTPLVNQSTDPDGVTALQYVERGFGWTHMYCVGSVDVVNGKADVWWDYPAGEIEHRIAGFPLAALRSRVEPLDVPPRFSEGEDPPPSPTPRQRWQLPAREIFNRGLATSDLPRWAHAIGGRRLPLVPVVDGFVGDALIYAAIYGLLNLAFGLLARRRVSLGFEVVMADFQKGRKK
jgi:hypothetical protein